ncbi:MAG: hypothetical protein GKS07_07765 [Nitrosopumilus sp.]|nr:MAG: hypothetical protein GKS07_07765 [Nitrosopumilus sp.]
MKRAFVLVLIIIIGFTPYASAAQLDAKLLSGEDFTEPSFQFLRIVYIEYPDGGEISKLLQGTKQTISFDADSSTPGISNLVAQLNHNLQADASSIVVTNVKVNYQAMLHGNEDHAVIEYKMDMIPTIANHIIAKSTDKSIIDASWRGLSVNESIEIETAYGIFDVNDPRSALDVMIPDVSKKLKDVKIIELPLVNAGGILELPLFRWHSLFDNTAIIPGAVEYKYTGENVITHYSMGECSIDVGLCGDRKWTEDVVLDKRYTVRIIESRDDATIMIEGYVDTTHIKGIEVFQTDLKSVVTQKPDTDEFPATVMYGMAGFAIIGTIVMFVVSNQKIKKGKDEGQTGIDPADLRAYETSESAGSYKTNRGESIFVSKEKSHMAI